MKTALVHDWLTGMRGGEYVLQELCKIFPDAPLYTIIHIPTSVSGIIENRKIYVSPLQYIPFGKKSYRHFLPLIPLMMSFFSFKKYDLIISVSHCVAKNAKPRKGAIHISYCNSPMRYIWDMFGDYFSPSRSLPVYLLMLILRPILRFIDVRTSKNATYFIGNSNTIRERINMYYNRRADVIFPPVDVDFYTPSHDSRQDYYLIVSSLVPYKRTDLAVEAFNINGKKLRIIGMGPESEYLKSIAGPNIEFQGWRSRDDLRDNYRRCRALIFPGKEDFGIVPVEAMACGAPVIAYGVGGATETVIDSKTGVYFMHQDADCLSEAIVRFETMSFDKAVIRLRAQEFSTQIFINNIKNYVEEKTGCCL
ncbi:glycosyltransferase [Elusimicrobiota bacterium]